MLVLQVWGVSTLTASLGWNHGLGWLPAQLNAGRLDLFFVLLAGERQPSAAAAAAGVDAWGKGYAQRCCMSTGRGWKVLKLCGETLFQQL